MKRKASQGYAVETKVPILQTRAEIRDGLNALNRRQTEEMERMQRLLAELGDKLDGIHEAKRR